MIIASIYFTIFSLKMFFDSLHMLMLLQMAPSYEPTAEPMAATRPVRGKTLRNRYDRSSMTLASQIWKKNGTCPEGTVPVRRIQNGLLEANSPEAYRRYKSIHPTKQLQDDENPNTQLPNRSV